FPAESLAESLVRAPNGGAIAVWASSSLTSSASQVAMDRELFRLLFTGAYPTLGEAIAAAKKATNDIDVRRSWNLLGDPATHLKGLVPRTFTNTSTRAKDLAEARRASKAAARAAQATETTAPPHTAANDNDAKDAKDAGDTHRALAWEMSVADLNGDRRADVLLYNHDSGA